MEGKAEPKDRNLIVIPTIRAANEEESAIGQHCYDVIQESGFLAQKLRSQ
jgi:hypothetical protein